MANLVLEIVFTVLFIISLVFNLILGSWLYVVLDTIIVILGVINLIFAYKTYKAKRQKENGEKIILDSLVFIFSVILLIYFISISIGPIVITLGTFLAIKRAYFVGFDIWLFQRKKKRQEEKKNGKDR